VFVTVTSEGKTKPEKKQEKINGIWGENKGLDVLQHCTFLNAIPFAAMLHYCRLQLHQKAPDGFPLHVSF